MVSRSTVVKLGFLIGFGPVFGFGLIVATLPAAAQGYSQEQQQLCSSDAFRLCGPEIPDVDRVTACMIKQRASLSPGCKSVFRYDPPGAAVAAQTRTARPIGTRTKASKVRKSKKTPR